MSRFARTFARIRIVAENHPPLFWRFFRWLVFRACARKFRCRFPSARKALVRLGSKPILLVHGEKDSYIPVAQSQELYACARCPKELWIVDAAAHNRSVRVAPKEYARRIVDFFGTHLYASVPMEAPADSGVEQESPITVPQGALVGAGLGRSPAEQID